MLSDLSQQNEIVIEVHHGTFCNTLVLSSTNAVTLAEAQGTAKMTGICGIVFNSNIRIL